MKRILVSLTLVGIVGCSLAGFAQTTSPTSDAAAAAASVTPATDAAPPGSAPDAAPAPDAVQVAAVDAAPQDAPATTPPAAEPAAAAPDAANASSTIQAGAIIPLIVMDDVPLTDAIRNLARQAEINYMLDPKIGFGQMGADGKITPQPNVTIRWEKITAGQALTALLNNHNLELVEDPKSKISRVTTKNPAALPPLITKIIQLKYASPSNVVASVQATFTDKRSKVMPDIRTSQLVVVATEPEMVDVDLLVESLDLKTKQVLIEARIMETGINPTTHKGIDWAGTLAAQNVTAGNNAIGGVLQDPKLIMTGSAATFFNPFFLNADGVSAVISFLNTYAEVRELSTPRTVTLDNEKATIEVGELYPVVNTSASTVNTSGGSSISYSNLTIRLEVTPRISADNYVNLTVNPTIMKLGPNYKSVVGGVPNAVNSFLTRTMTTKVMIPSGNTLVMGGLIQDQINSGNTKVPLLGDIPVLGYLFRSDSKDRKNSDLVLFITPTIVQDEDYQATKTDFLKRPVPKKDVLEGEWSAWDSGKPKDWSKPAAAPEFEDPNTMVK